MSQVYVGNGSGGGGGGGIETINGDDGSITGSNVTIFANQATNNSGASVQFNNVGTVSTLNLSDVDGNTNLGVGSGNIALSPGDTSNNTFLGKNCGAGVLAGAQNNTIIGAFSANTTTMTGSNNVGLGFGVLDDLTSGTQNTAVGLFSGVTLQDGSRNVLYGVQSGANYSSSESDNICIGNPGATAESNVIRIGADGTGNNQQNMCFIGGINGNTVSNANFVTIDTVTGQLGTTSSPSGSSVYFQAYLSAPQNMTASSTSEVIIFDSTTTNVGSGYSTSTGRFTAPTTGFYSFAATIYFLNLSSAVGHTGAIIAYTGSTQSARLIQQGPGAEVGGTVIILTVSFAFPMTAGDVVELQPFVDGTGTYTIFGTPITSTSFTSMSIFSGFKVN